MYLYIMCTSIKGGIDNIESCNQSFVIRTDKQTRSLLEVAIAHLKTLKIRIDQTLLSPEFIFTGLLVS